MPLPLAQNLMASLKKVGKGGKTAISIETEDLFFDPDDKILAKALAAVMVAQLRDNLLMGMAPDFTPLPGISAGTVKARQDDQDMSSRGGQASDRYVDNAFRANARNNFERDYTAQRLGRFHPKTGGPRGVVSGMLAASFAARPGKDGKSMLVYVAAKRGAPRPAGISGRKAEMQSSLESVYGSIPLWSPAANETPGVKKAMLAAAKSIFGKDIKGLRQLAKAMIKELAGAASELNEFAERDE